MFCVLSFRRGFQEGNLPFGFGFFKLYLHRKGRADVRLPATREPSLACCLARAREARRARSSFDCAGNSEQKTLNVIPHHNETRRRLRHNGVPETARDANVPRIVPPGATAHYFHFSPLRSRRVV